MNDIVGKVKQKVLFRSVMGFNFLSLYFEIDVVTSAHCTKVKERDVHMVYKLSAPIFSIQYICHMS